MNVRRTIVACIFEPKLVFILLLFIATTHRVYPPYLFDQPSSSQAGQPQANSSQADPVLPSTRALSPTVLDLRKRPFTDLNGPNNDQDTEFHLSGFSLEGWEDDTDIT
jgi:hypothetical protein